MAKKKKSKKKRKNVKSNFWNIVNLIVLLVILGFSIFFAYKLLFFDHLKSRNSFYPYEEKNSLLEEKIKEVDLIFLNTAKELNVSLKKIKYKNVFLKEQNKNLYHYQEIYLYLPDDQKKKFLNYFFQHLKNLPYVDVKINSNTINLKLNGILTHRIKFLFKEAEEKSSFGELLLIIDDMGRSLYSAKRLYSLLGKNVIFSILPYAPYTKETVKFAQERGIEYLLHLPMEPENYPEADPGKGALFVKMSKKEIINTFYKDLSRVPGAIGVNNHMGSKFTANERSMKILLQAIADKKIFFLDSLTTPKSVTLKVAKHIKSLKVYYRDLFLDSQKDSSYVYFQLKKAVDLTKLKKRVIVIGHPYEETLLGLAQWIKNYREIKVALGSF